MNEILDGQVTIFTSEIGRQAACNAFAVNARSYRHRRQVQTDGAPLRARDARPKRARKPHPAELSAAEREAVLAELCSERFYDLPPAQVYNTLLDEGVYLCSTKHMYRLLADHGLSQDRRKGGHSRQGQHAVPVLEADAPNICWTWDITSLKGPVRGVKYFLYTIIDIFSRYVVGWTVSTRETAATARKLIADTCLVQGITPDQLTLHADRGSPMIAGSMTELLAELIESLNYQLRKIIKNRGHFPSDQSAVKLLWLAICNIEDKRARESEKARNRPKGAPRKSAAGKLIQGAATTNWKQALAQLALTYPERISPHL